MKSKKIMLILITAIFFASIAGVCASDANDTMVASDDTGEIELSHENEMSADNLQTGKENDELALEDNDESVSAQTGTEVLSVDNSTYSMLSSEVSQPGNVKLTHKNYVYDKGNSISINENNKVIDGNGAVIDMSGSNIRAFDVISKGVTIKNLTIKNVNFWENGGAIKFAGDSASVINCKFINNTAENGGAIYFDNTGNVENCNFTDNHAFRGAALNGGEAYNCIFINNSAGQDGGGIFDGKAYDCTFIGNSANFGGAFYKNEAYNCNFINNSANSNGGAVFMGNAVNCNFTDNHAVQNGGAIYEGTSAFNNFKTSSDTIYNTNLPTFTVSKSLFRFDLGDKLLFNLTCDNKNYDGYNTTITLTKDGNPVGVYYALSGSDEGWSADLSPGIYVATLSMEQYAVKPIKVTIIIGMMNVSTYSALADEIASGGSVINLQYRYYVYDNGDSISINENNKVIDGNGAVIDMSGSTIRAFDVISKGVTIKNLTIKNVNFWEKGGAIKFAGDSGAVINCNFINNTAQNGGAIYFSSTGNVENCSFVNNSATSDGGAVWMSSASVTNCNFTDNHAYRGAALYGGEAYNCIFINNSAGQDGGGIFNGKAYDCTFIGNSANFGGAFYKNEAYNCNFINNSANSHGGAVFMGNAVNCNFTDNHAVQNGGAIYEGTSAFNNFKTSSDTIYNTNLPTFTVSKSYFIFNSGDKLLFNLTCDNKNYDGYNTTITLTKDGNPVGVYYALSGPDEGWSADLSPGIYVATLSMEQYAVKPITVYIIIGMMNVSTYSALAGEIASGGDYINLQYRYYVYDNGDSISITENNTVIDGNGAVIYMARSNIRAFDVIGNGVTIKNLTIINVNFWERGGAIKFAGDSGAVINCNFIYNTAQNGGAIYFDNTGNVENCSFVNNSATINGGAVRMSGGSVTNCNFTDNHAFRGAALYGGEAYDCTFIGNSAGQDGGGIFNGEAYDCTFIGNSAGQDGGGIFYGKAYDCTFIGNSANFGGAFYKNEAYNCNFINNSATTDGGAVFMGNAVNCNFTDNHAVQNGGAIYGGTSAFNNFKTSSDTIYNTNIPTFTVSKSLFRFDLGEKLLFNLICDNKNYDGYNTTITLTKDGNPVGVYYALSGPGEGWSADLSPGIYVATLSMEQYAVKPITVNIITGMMNVSTYSALAGEIASGGDYINLQYGYYVYDYGSSIEITKPDIVINGNGAVIIMVGSTIRAFDVISKGVTIKNLTIKNVNFWENGGAIKFAGDFGAVINCNFINNTAQNGGAIYFDNTGNVENCSFVNNSARGDGGALHMDYGTVTNSMFTNNVCGRSGAILSYYLETVTADACIFKTDSDSTYQVHIIPPTLNVDNFTTFYGFGEKLTFDLRTNINSIPVTNGNISISVYFKDNNSWVGNYSCLSGEGWIPDLPAGSYYAIFDTEYSEFKPINRTIKIICYVNVTSLTTNNRTVNITAKSNIPQDIVQGKLLFILPNGKNITANYVGNGTWWAVHRFDDCGVYQVSASYIGLDNVTINNATITVSKVNTVLTADAVTATYNSNKKLVVTLKDVNGKPLGGVKVTVKIKSDKTYTTDANGQVKISVGKLTPKTYNVKIAFKENADFRASQTTVKVTVKKAKSKITAKKKTIKKAKKYTVTLKSGKKPIKKVKVILKIKKKTFKAKTNKKGKATFKIKKLKKGKYTAKVTFKGNMYYKNASKKVKITVK